MKLIFDTETTGLDPVMDEILQLSAIDEDGKVLINEYFKPNHTYSWPGAEKVNHISPEMVKNCRSIKEALPEIQAIFSGADELIAYNAAFDIAFLEKAGIVMPDVQVSDVMLKFAGIYGEWNNYFQDYKWQKLSKCAAYYGYKSEKFHDSLEDVRATLFCYEKIHEKR